MLFDRAQRDRREIKYIISEDVALAVRAYLSSYLEADEFAAGKPDNSYAVHSLYLDSDRLSTYHSALDGQRNRFKLRIRYYNEDWDSPVFFEVKRRINVGVVKQRARVRREAVKSLLEGASPQPEHLFKWNDRHWTDLLEFWQLVEKMDATPRAHNSYLREAYVNEDATVRVTLDRAIQIGPEFRGHLGVAMEEGIEVFGGTVVLELKFTDRMPTWLIEMVRGFDLKSTGAAKYVQGVALLGEHKVARRLVGFEWGNAVTSTPTSAPWLDSSLSVREALGPSHE